MTISLKVKDTYQMLWQYFFNYCRSKIEEMDREKNNNTHPSQLINHHNTDIDKPLNLNTRDVITTNVIHDDSGTCGKCIDR